MEEDLSPEERREEERDPWLGRVGVEALPGVYAAPILGTFSFPTCRIDLNAYVYDPEIPDRRRWECYLRLRMLATLVHELAHFQDYKLRTARGRWRADDEDKAEVYAERTTARWVREIAVPWLEEAYPADVHDLEAWVAHHGGATIPLELLAGSWHWDFEGRVVEDLVFGGANSAFKSLVCNVHKGVEPSEACLDFAEELHWGGLHPEAHRVLERILLDEPSNLAALTLRADVFVHEEEHDRAEALARQVIGLDESYVDAWHVLADVHEARADWERLYESAGQAIARKSEERDRWSFREQRARAELELGREAELAEDLEALKHSVPIAATAADAFRALQLVRKGRFEEALEIAQLSRTYVVARHRAVFDAVRFEASHRLGRAGLAGRLTPRTIRTLGYLHLGSWADRLVSEFGRGKSY